MARPEKPINWDLVERKMQAGCSAREIYGELRISDDTFYARFKKEFGKSFSEYSDEFHYVGKGNIRYMQYEKALEGNIQMLTLLGKFWLDQRDKEKEDPDIGKIAHEISEAIKKQSNIRP